MKKLGLVGGLGPVSTLDYYRLINEKYREIVKPESVAGDNPHMTIESLNLGVAYEIVSAADWDKLTEYQMGAINRCVAAGAEFGAVAANTGHIVFDRMVELSPIPLVGMIDETCKFAKRQGMDKILVYGTRFTMDSGMYEGVGSKYGVECILPEAEDKQTIHNIIFPNLEANIVDPDQKVEILDLSKCLLKETGADGLVLGCTELPLIIKEGELDTTLIDATMCHIDAIVDYIING